jgi:hypothetical protein
MRSSLCLPRFSWSQECRSPPSPLQPLQISFLASCMCSMNSVTYATGRRRGGPRPWLGRAALAQDHPVECHICALPVLHTPYLLFVCATRTTSSSAAASPKSFPSVHILEFYTDLKNLSCWRWWSAKFYYVRKFYLRHVRMKNGNTSIVRFCRRVSHYRVIEDV